VTRNGKAAPGVMVRTENLTKTFVGIEALAGLDIEVPEGAVFALIGPQWCGQDDGHQNDHEHFPANFRTCGGARC
jgi:ABC-type uncharacterized transport system ATPase subunit